jgi:hypothetical protein
MQIVVHSQIVDVVAFCIIEISLTNALNNMANYTTKWNTAFDCSTVFAATVMMIALCVLLMTMIERALGRVGIVNLNSPITLMKSVFSCISHIMCIMVLH